MGRLQRFEIRLDRRLAQFGLAGEPAPIELPSTPAEQEPEQRQEALAVPDPEQLQNVPRVKAVHPFTEGGATLLLPKERLGHPPWSSRRSRSPTPKGSAHSSHRTGHRWTASFRPVSESRNLPVAASVEEPVASTRSSGYSSAAIFRTRLGSGEAVDLVQHDGRPRTLAAKKQLRVRQLPSDGGAVAVPVDCVWKHSGQRRLAHPPHPGEPDDRRRDHA